MVQGMGQLPCEKRLRRLRLFQFQGELAEAGCGDYGWGLQKYTGKEENENKMDIHLLHNNGTVEFGNFSRRLIKSR